MNKINLKLLKTSPWKFTEQERKDYLRFIRDFGLDLYQLPPGLIDALRKRKPTKEKLAEIKQHYLDVFYDVQNLQKMAAYSKPHVRFNGGIRLVNIRNISIQNPSYIFKDLYPILYSYDLFCAAYERLRKNKGSLTPGPDQLTLDEVTESTFIDNIIISLRNKNYKPGPVRRTYIPKPGKETKRPLGIPNAQDKLVQELIRLILSAIYEPTFYPCSHGFQANKSAVTAAHQVASSFQGVVWVVEGNISCCFDEMDHALIIKILRKRIRDERFLALIKSFLDAGYLDPIPKKEGSKKQLYRLVKPKMGSPQGNIFSPILCNIVLHEFDTFNLNLAKSWEAKWNFFRPKYSPTKIYQQLTQKIRNAKRALKSGKLKKHAKYDMKSLRSFYSQRQRIESSKEESTKTLRIVYVRYADDWVIGVKGARKMAHKLKHYAKNFLLQKLKLRLSEEKTKITNIIDSSFCFGGFNFSRSRKFIISRSISEVGKKTLEAKLLKAKTNKEKSKLFKQYSTAYKHFLKVPKVRGNIIYVTANMEKILFKLHIRGLCDSRGNPVANKAWFPHPAVDIVQTYANIFNGYLYAYLPTQNLANLFRILYIIRHSCAKTLAKKYKKEKQKKNNKKSKRIWD
eukprot:TRINITY_DN1072_c0_g2_i5.p1 TRINITY_DN1072_c0_g2~~TRINITY_DN1072_c0_g2_i5.p1  ORF type:complete len:625 (+),score=23.64 TRINITY_DN1072_c0_g2_i5:771-2645(+)